MIFAAPAQGDLAAEVSRISEIPLGNALIGQYPDGERNVRLLDDPAGLTAIFLFSTGPPVDANTLALAFLADAAKRAGARSVVAVVPYLGYSRGEKLSKKGDPISCRVIADLLQGAGVDHFLTLDLHSPAIPGFFRVPVFEGSLMEKFSKAFHPSEKTVVVAPDAGGFKRAAFFASLLGLPLAVAFKERPAIEARVLRLCGDLEEREAIVLDDMVSTGGTIAQVAKLLLARGVRTIDCAVTHPVFSNGAFERLREAGIRRFLVSDSLPFSPPEDWPALEVLSIAPLLASMIERLLCT
ncbi:MAG TPA: ribose-phosphate pyrophosphokinase [Chroococcales cyanobacterium]